MKIQNENSEVCVPIQRLLVRVALARSSPTDLRPNKQLRNPVAMNKPDKRLLKRSETFVPTQTEIKVSCFRSSEFQNLFTLNSLRSAAFDE